MIDEYNEMSRRILEQVRKSREQPRYGYVQGVSEPVLFVDDKLADRKWDKDKEYW